jgi:oligopeptide/dipeptide ABC transporter ATP-binding protein
MSALLAVEDLEVNFKTRRGTIHAVNGVSFELDAGETLGIVGESGCGKSVTALAMMGILPRAGIVPSGSVRFGQRELLGLKDSELRDIRGKDISMIFQDPMTSLNPVLKIGKQITESLRRHLGMNEDDARTEAIRLLARVGIPDANNRLTDYPHQFSGGMRQRVMIAMAIACKPKLLIADEPTTALDVTIQAQILDLLKRLVMQEGMALILITHDLGVVAGICDRTNVMYGGRFIETGPTTTLFADPRHPYTVGLLRSVPRLDASGKERLHPISGAVRTLKEKPEYCAFAPRCPNVQEDCRQSVPPLYEMGPEHRVACFHPVSDETVAAIRARGSG